MEGCLKPVRSRKSDYSRSSASTSVEVDESLSLALCLPEGRWGAEGHPGRGLPQPHGQGRAAFPGEEGSG